MDYNNFLILNKDRFPSASLSLMRDRLENAEDGQAYAVMTAEYKNPTVAFVLSFFLGTIGIDRFYIGNIGLGIGKLAVSICTAGFGGAIWWFVDLFLIMNATRQKNYELFMQRLALTTPMGMNVNSGSSATATKQEQTQTDQSQDSDFDDF